MKSRISPARSSSSFCDKRRRSDGLRIDSSTTDRQVIAVLMDRDWPRSMDRDWPPLRFGRSRSAARRCASLAATESGSTRRPHVQSGAMTPDEFRASGHDLIDWIADYIGGIEHYRVQPDVEPGQIRAMLPADPPTRPEPFSAVMADVERIVLPGITHWQHPNFYAYFPANSSFPSIL